jgi:hypothetical protein
MYNRYLSPNILENINKIKEKVVEGFEKFLKQTKCAKKWTQQHLNLIH